MEQQQQKQQQREQALNIVNSLANGINPVTGEYFAPDSPYNHPDIIRALFWLIQNPSHNSAPPAIRKTKEERQQENLAKGLPINHGLAWQEEQKEEALRLFRNNSTVNDIALHLGRKPTSIASLLFKHELINEEQAQALGLRYTQNTTN